MSYIETLPIGLFLTSMFHLFPSVMLHSFHCEHWVNKIHGRQSGITTQKVRTEGIWSSLECKRIWFVSWESYYETALYKASQRAVTLAAPKGLYFSQPCLTLPQLYLKLIYCTVCLFSFLRSRPLYVCYILCHPVCFPVYNPVYDPVSIYLLLLKWYHFQGPPVAHRAKALTLKEIGLTTVARVWFWSGLCAVCPSLSLFHVTSLTTILSKNKAK